jgi:hypothetical protein
MQPLNECTFERLLSSGLPVVLLDGHEVIVELRGIEILQPLSDLYRDIFQIRLPAAKRPLRCETESVPRDGRVTGKLFYFAWQDKSGDVWKDVAQLLLEQGLAKSVAGNYPEREEYLQYERSAQHR